MPFDPDAAAAHDGLYGLPDAAEAARFVVVPVPFDATTSYRHGARFGPLVVRAASLQVDLEDIDFGAVWRSGIAMLPLDRGPALQIARIGERARRLARPIIAAGGRLEGRPRRARAVAAVNAASTRVNAIVETAVREVLRDGKVPFVLGGDHCAPYGAIAACAARYPGLGILHVDAHADLREAFEGFTYSHASIMWNVVHRIGARGGVATLAQVGLRDLGRSELALIRAPRRRDRTRMVAYLDAELAVLRDRGRSWRKVCDGIVARLPRRVYLSIDIDGLDPKLCPDTGSPVPGGLDWEQMVELLRAVVRARRRIVGGDLCEVAPSPRARRTDHGGDWNGNVGARLLYKMMGAAARAGRA